MTMSISKKQSMFLLLVESKPILRDLQGEEKRLTLNEGSNCVKCIRIETENDVF